MGGHKAHLGCLQEEKKQDGRGRRLCPTVNVPGWLCSRTKELWLQLMREQLREACCHPALSLVASKHTSNDSANTLDD